MGCQGSTKSLALLRVSSATAGHSKPPSGFPSIEEGLSAHALLSDGSLFDVQLPALTELQERVSFILLPNLLKTCLSSNHAGRWGEGVDVCANTEGHHRPNFLRK